MYCSCYSEFTILSSLTLFYPVFTYPEKSFYYFHLCPHAHHCIIPWGSNSLAVDSLLHRTVIIRMLYTCNCLSVMSVLQSGISNWLRKNTVTYLLFHLLSYVILSYLALPCHTLPSPILSCLTVPCLAMPCGTSVY